MDYKVMLDVLRRRKARNFNSKGVLDEEPMEEVQEKPELLDKEVAVLGEGLEKNLSEVDQEDDLLPGRKLPVSPSKAQKRPGEEGDDEEGEIAPQSQESVDYGLNPFGRKFQKQPEMNGKSSDLDQELADESVMQRIKKGKKPKGLYERMQANLGKKMYKGGDEE